MERNYYTEGFESFLKEKADQYKLYPSQRVWKSINRQLHPRSNWPYLAVMILLFVGIGITGKLYLTGGKSTLADASASAGVNETSLPIAKNTYPTALFAKEKSRVTKISPTSITNLRSDLRSDESSTEVSDFNLNAVSLPETVSTNSGEKLLSPQTMEFGRVITSPALTFDARNGFLQETAESSEQDKAASEKSLALKNSSKNKWEWQLYLSPTVS